MQEDIKWAAAQVSVYLDLDHPDMNRAVDTTLVITVDDNCNTGFSDDSGVQQPCLRDTDSVRDLTSLLASAGPACDASYEC
jgi:hypothetical protein